MLSGSVKFCVKECGNRVYADEGEDCFVVASNFGWDVDEEACEVLCKNCIKKEIENEG